jgi:hypothetical protein
VGVPACAQSCSEEGEKVQDKDNAETRRTQRFREEDGDVGWGWESMFTVEVTATRDDVSSYFLCSNDSNGMHMRRKSIRGLEMRGNLVVEGPVVWGSA